MPRIDEMPEHRAKLPHSTHVLSHSLGLTSTVAHLQPIFHTLMDAGDSIELGVQFTLRTQPLSSAAMEDIDCHVEYFFVPMFLLYQPFGSMYYQIEDEFSSNFDMSQLALNKGNFPVWDWFTLWAILQGNKNTYPYTQNLVPSGETLGAMGYRLLDLFHFHVENAFFNTGVYDPDNNQCPYNPNVFPYQFLAYHCIYQYRYRLDNREKFNNKSFNWDRFYNVSQASLTNQEIFDLFTLHYRPKNDDYFTNIKVSPIVDVLNLLDKTQLATTNQWLSRGSMTLRPLAVSSGGIGDASSTTGLNSPFGNNFNNPSSVIQTQFGNTNNPSAAGPSTYNAASFDIGTANIRAMFANEKLWSITGRAKKHYDDQTLAHFGFKPKHDVKHEITQFGHDHTIIKIGEVISTASTATADLGSIAGKGYAHLNPQKHVFHAPVHGVVMAILSFNPRLRYVDTFGKYNAVTGRLSLPVPEYDHLGMQPLFRYEYMIYGNGGGAISDIMGWQYRYEEWKRRFNRVTSAFRFGNPLYSWMIGVHPFDSNQSNVANTSSFADFIYKPDVLNSIMLAQYSMTWNSAWDTNASMIYDLDPFVVDCQIDCKLHSWMSDYSLPRLDA